MLKTILLVILFCVSSRAVHSQEDQEEQKKYNLSICAIFKNEARFLKEWLEYHRMIGVDHFYLYDEGSIDRYKKVILPYIQDGIVTYVKIPSFSTDEYKDFIYALGTQGFAFENAARVRGKETKWLVFLNVDEFLVPTYGRDINDLLTRYEEYPGIILATEHYDAARYNGPSRADLVIETVNLAAAPKQSIQRLVTKTIFKTDECTNFTWPPYTCYFREDKKPVALRRQELGINRYLDRFFMGAPNLKKPNEKLRVDNIALSEEEQVQYLQLGYEIVDRERVISRFIPDLIQRLEKK